MLKKFVKLFEGSINFELTKQKLYQTVSGLKCERRPNETNQKFDMDIKVKGNMHRKIVKNACLAIEEALSRQDSTHVSCESRLWRLGVLEAGLVTPMALLMFASRGGSRRRTRIFSKKTRADPHPRPGATGPEVPPCENSPDIPKNTDFVGINRGAQRQANQGRVSRPITLFHIIKQKQQ